MSAEIQKTVILDVETSGLGALLWFSEKLVACKIWLAVFFSCFVNEKITNIVEG